jgi:hypothetical protein
VIALVAVAAVAGCGDDDDDSDTTDSAGVVDTAVSPADVPDIVGQSVDDATATLEDAGYTLRVIQRDGEDLAATADFVENRVNVAVETGDDGTETVTEVISTG